MNEIPSSEEKSDGKVINIHGASVAPHGQASFRCRHEHGKRLHATWMLKKHGERERLSILVVLFFSIDLSRAD